MEQLRKPFQGVTNIVRFNWHLYLLSIAAVLTMLIADHFIHNKYQFYINILIIVVTVATLISLLASLYIYDLSDLYSLHWLDKLNISPNSRMVNINAGFDETSSLIALKYPRAEFSVFDFYDPQKHTEISIKRAGKAYPPYKNTTRISTSALPMDNNSADSILVIFAAHEIRNDDERVVFFKELNRVVKDEGKIIITEHIRDLPNFAAFNIGVFHFLSMSSWLTTFSKSGLKIAEEIKITPFITTFILIKNGIAS
jgi:ubiquinone/menaquinone biosynthesis C-methylase UbiE